VSDAPGPPRPERLDVRLERGAVEIDEVVSIARLLANHLDARHREGRIDGNLSPQRIEVGAGEEPRLTKIDEERPPTKAYIAPETWTSDATPASDQFAMAAILYEALCGGRAFPGDDSEKIRISITTGSRVPLAARVPGLADAVDGVFEKALAFDPEERFPSCSSFADALVDAIEKSRDAASVLVQKPSSSKPSSRRPPMLGADFFDDEPPPPIPWLKLIALLLLLALAAAVVASLTK
jgi:serine/threonine protein kinase